MFDYEKRKLVRNFESATKQSLVEVITETTQVPKETALRTETKESIHGGTAKVIIPCTRRLNCEEFEDLAFLIEVGKDKVHIGVEINPDVISVHNVRDYIPIDKTLPIRAFANSKGARAVFEIPYFTKDDVFLRTEFNTAIKFCIEQYQKHVYKQDNPFLLITQLLKDLCTTLNKAVH